MKSKLILRVFLWASLSMPLCQSYSAPLYWNEMLYRTPSYFYNDITSNHGLNDLTPGNHMNVHQMQQQPHFGLKHVNKNMNYQSSDFRDFKVHSSNNLNVKKRCPSWTSPEGIRFVLPHHPNPTERSHHTFTNDADCDSQSQRSNYSPSYYSPGFASNLFYDA